MRNAKMSKKCYTCRKALKDEKKVFCKSCEKKPRSTSSTLIIWNKV